ncbi:MAG: RibD family protein [Bacillota bacterium]
MTLGTKNFNIEDVKLNQIYADFDKNYQNSDLELDKLNKIYGQLKLLPCLTNRPLLLGCFVSSIDGTIAFKDNPQSGQIARSQKHDRAGGEADLWILNLLRTIADGIILGPKTLRAEKNLTAHILDKDLAAARVEMLNKPQVPYNIIVTKTGASIPYHHRIFEEEKVPVLIATSPQGAKVVKENVSCNYKLINLNKIKEFKKEDLDVNNNTIIILVSGKGHDLADKLLLKFLKQMGLDRITVETPSYAHYLIRQQLLDELFLNQSGVYIGGPKFLNNNGEAAFTVNKAPAAKVITIHNHSSYFFYLRYRLIY